MINSSDFSKRLQKVIDFYEESASSFADKVGVQRSSISHIISGRNKPSLDFVLKILSAYPEVELYWLLNGKGQFPPTQPETSLKPSTGNRVSIVSDKHSEESKMIDRIVIFYSDGTFENFTADHE